MKKLISFCILLFLLPCAQLFAEQFSKPVVGKPHRAKGSQFVEVYGHRGDRSYSPENTIPGYSTALKVGVNWVDLDIVYTKDRKIIVYHDLYLNPNLIQNENGKYITTKTPVYELTYDQMKKFDVGQIKPGSSYAKYFPNQVPVPNTHIPLLSDVIQYVKKNSYNVNFQIEIKTDPEHPDWAPPPKQFAKDLYKILTNYNIVNRVEIHAFHWPYLYELQKLNKNIKTGYLVSSDEIKQMHDSDPKIAGMWTGGKLLKDYNNSLPQMVKSLGGCCYEPQDTALTKAQLDEAHKLGLKVVVWTWPERSGTAFSPDIVAKLIEWGIDGIVTDNPGQLNSMLAARNLPIPRNFPAGYKK